MNGSECAALSNGYVGRRDDDPPWVWPDEFINEPAPVLWLDDSLDVDVAAVEMGPGPVLAAALSDVNAAELDDAGLLTVIGAWRRLAAWAVAGEAALVAAFVDRRVAGGGGIRAWESAAGELAAEFTLTGYGVERLVELAGPLAELLPGTREALRRGVIGEAKARVIARAVDGVLDAGAARRVEDAVLPAAPGQTTGQLRHAVERAVIAVDPGAAERRRVRAEAGRRVEVRATDAHTADLCGRDLPAARALAADNRINALARALKTDGAPEPMAALRAEVFLGLLLGTGPVSAWPPPGQAAGAPAGCGDPGDVRAHDRFERAAEWGDRGRAGEVVEADRVRGRRVDGAVGEDGRPGVRDRIDRRCDGDGGGGGCGDGVGEDTDGCGRHVAGAGGPVAPGTGPGGGVAGSVHVIVPMETLTGRAERPGMVPGFGAVPASVARSIAEAASGRRWCYTVVDRTGRPVRHGHLTTGADLGLGDLSEVIAERVAGEVARGDPGFRDCRFENVGLDGAGPEVRHVRGAYRPPDGLRHEIEIRDGTCRFPSCRRPAVQCDLDHTVPYDDGGVTCGCNMAPLCRKHHQLKQMPGWTLTQPEPGRLIWTTPTGRSYPSAPFPYA